MFIFEILILTKSANRCPSSINHLYNTATDATIPANGWFFFYSEYIENGDVQTIHVYPANDVELYIGNGLMCPSESDAPILPAKKGVVSKIDVSVKEGVGAQIYGIRAREATDVVVSIEGKNRNNYDINEWRVYSLIFLISCFLLMGLLFFHALMARNKVHYQVQIGN